MEAGTDERELVRQAVAGSDSAFTTLLERNRGVLWSICLRITGNHHDAQDALQDAIVAAWRNLDRFRGDSRFSTWLYRITVNAALRIVRKRRDGPASDGDMFSDIPVADGSDAVDNSDVVQQCLSKVPEPYRAALVLRVWGDCSYQEIADHLDIPVQTVKSRIHRAKRDLRARIDVADAVG